MPCAAASLFSSPFPARAQSHRPSGPVGLLAPLVALLGLVACGGGGALRVEGSAEAVPPRGTAALSVPGAPGTLRWSLAVNGSGGRVDGQGHYQAGSTGDTVDVVVAETDGARGSFSVRVGPGVTVERGAAALRPWEATQLTPRGGAGSGYTFALDPNRSGGTIDGAGLYRAGPTGGVDDTVVVLDGLGNGAAVDVHVVGQLEVQPGFEVVAAGAELRFSAPTALAPLTFSLAASPSGGRIDADTGRYVAGAAGGTDVVLLRDALGDEGLATVRVRPAGRAPAPHTISHARSAGGPVLRAPVLVTIAYPDDPRVARIDALGRTLTRSPWLAQVGGEYGIFAASHAPVVLPENAPARLGDGQIEDLLVGLVDAGAVPRGEGDFIYMIFFPPQTRVTLQGVPLCEATGGGYHYEQVDSGGRRFAYAVIGPCAYEGSSADDNLELAASHELIEAATDPYPQSEPGLVLANEQTDPWGQVGGELADLCAFAPPVRQDGFVLTTVFSERSAAAGDSPCPPYDGPYFSVSAPSTRLQAVGAGQRYTFTLTGWSTRPVGPWTLYAAPMAPLYLQAFTPELTLGRDTLDDGQTTTLTVTVPAGTPSRSATLVYVGSYQDPAAPIGALFGVYVP